MGYLPDSLAHRPPPRDRAAPLRRQAAAGDRALARTRDARVQGRGHRQLADAGRRRSPSSRPPRRRRRRRRRRRHAAGARDRLARTWRGFRAVSATPRRRRSASISTSCAAGSSSCSARSPSGRSSPTSSTTHVLNWLNQPLPPDHRKLATFGVAEPFTITITVSLYAGFVLALPVVLWQLWLFFAPAVEPAAERKVLALARLRRRPRRGRRGVRLLGPAAARRPLPHELRQRALPPPDPSVARTTTSSSRCSSGVVIVFQTPLVVLGLVSLGVLSSQDSAQAIGGWATSITAAIALALPGPDPVTTFLELLPMWLLFEGSIWLAVFVERRMAKSGSSLGYPGRLMARAAVKAKQQAAKAQAQPAKRVARGRAEAQRRRQSEPGALLRPAAAPPEVGLRRARGRLRVQLRRSWASAPAPAAA